MFENYNLGDQISALQQDAKVSKAKIDEKVPKAGVIDFYDKKLMKIKAEIEALDEVWQSVDSNAFDDFIEFMQ